MTNKAFYEHIENIKKGDEKLTKQFLVNCDKNQFEWIKSNFNNTFVCIKLIVMRWSGKIAERKEFELTNVDTSTWD